MTKKRPRRQYLRTTQTLSGTVAKTTVQLDARSQLGLEYAEAVLRRAGRQKAHPSGIVRRALALYVRHLEATDHLAELRAVGSASAVPAVPLEDQTLARLRLAAVPPGEPVPPFAVVMHGARVAAEQAALLSHLDSILDS